MDSGGAYAEDHGPGSVQAYDQLTWMRAQPIGVDKTLVEWGICGTFNILHGTKPDADHPILYYLHEIPKVNLEDK